MPVKTVGKNGRAYVMLSRDEYERLRKRADEADLPPLPKPNANGNYPALEYVRVSLARDLIRDRRALNLSQQQLARLAKVRQRTIQRLESGQESVDLRTFDKVYSALEVQKSKRSNKGQRTTKSVRS